MKRSFLYLCAQSRINIKRRLEDKICDLMEKMWNSFNQRVRSSKPQKSTDQPTDINDGVLTHTRHKHIKLHILCALNILSAFLGRHYLRVARRASNKNVYVCAACVYVCKLDVSFWFSSAVAQHRQRSSWARENIIIIAALQIYTYLINYN